jgi:hypothetical protein
MSHPNDNIEAGIDALLKSPELRALTERVMELTINVRDFPQNVPVVRDRLIVSLVRLYNEGIKGLTRDEFEDMLAILLLGYFSDDDVYKKP